MVLYVICINNLHIETHHQQKTLAAAETLKAKYNNIHRYIEL